MNANVYAYVSSCVNLNAVAVWYGVCSHGSSEPDIGWCILVNDHLHMTMPLLLA